MTKSKPVQTDASDFKTYADFRDKRDFKRFVDCVCQTIKALKRGATYRQLNSEYPNRAYWLNEAVEILEMAGKIRKIGSVQITKFISCDDTGIEPLPKFTKADFADR